MIPVKNTLINNGAAAHIVIRSTTNWQTTDLPLVDVDDILKAVDSTRKARDSFISGLNINFILDKTDISECKHYCFKVMRKDNNNGIFVTLPPENIGVFEIFMINNNILDKTSNVKFTEVNEIVAYYIKMLFKDEITFIKCFSIYKIINDKFPENFEVSNNNTNIQILDNRTNNGYCILFDDENCIATVYIIHNRKIFKKHKTTFYAKTDNEIVSKINAYIKNDMHNIKISMHRVKPATDVYNLFENCNIIDDSVSDINSSGANSCDSSFIKDDDDPI
jgi:hypothetical protein